MLLRIAPSCTTYFARSTPPASPAPPGLPPRALASRELIVGLLHRRLHAREGLVSHRLLRAQARRPRPRCAPSATAHATRTAGCASRRPASRSARDCRAAGAPESERRLHANAEVGGLGELAITGGGVSRHRDGGEDEQCTRPPHDGRRPHARAQRGTHTVGSHRDCKARILPAADEAKAKRK